MIIAMLGGGIASGVQVLCGRCVGRGDGGDVSKFSVELRMIFENGRVIISLRDNCKKFDPTNWHRKENEPDPMKGMGIRMVQQLAESVSYRHTLGLNVLSIEI